MVVSPGFRLTVDVENKEYFFWTIEGRGSSEPISGDVIDFIDSRLAKGDSFYSDVDYELYKKFCQPKPSKTEK
jgi:hypothetical protein